MTPDERVRRVIEDECVASDADVEALRALVAERDALAAEVERLRDKWEPDTDEPLPGPPSWEMLDKANGRWLAAEARVAAAEKAAMAAARLAELDAVSRFATYECEHGSTIAQECADDEGPIRCWAHEDMRTLHDWLAARAALAAADRPEGTTP